MGEGWADFHAMLLLVKDERPHAARQRGLQRHLRRTAYPAQRSDFAPDALNNAYYFGIRRYPYSRD